MAWVCKDSPAVTNVIQTYNSLESLYISRLADVSGPVLIVNPFIRSSLQVNIIDTHVDTLLIYY